MSKSVSKSKATPWFYLAHAEAAKPLIRCKQHLKCLAVHFPAVAVDETLLCSPGGMVRFVRAVDQVEPLSESTVQRSGIVTDCRQTPALLRSVRHERGDDDVSTRLNSVEDCST